MSTNKIQMAEFKARAKAILNSDAGDRRHGTEYGWVIGCRCDRCHEAHAAYARRYRARRARLRDTLTVNGS